MKNEITKVYFIRHAQSDNLIRDDRIRPLTEKGLADCRLVTNYLSDKNIDMVFSSPLKRAIDTVADFAAKYNFKIHTDEGFCERKCGWIEGVDFVLFMEQQWVDFNYKLSDGECLAEVQERNITALKKVLDRFQGKNIVIGTHGTALSTIINYFDNTYRFADFAAMAKIMPWVVRMSFDENSCLEIEKVDLFK